MLSFKLRPTLCAFALALSASVAASAQTPSATPPTPSPAQRDATRPPGSTQGTVPPASRPATVNPTAPPGSVTSPSTPSRTTDTAPAAPVTPQRPATIADDPARVNTDTTSPDDQTLPDPQFPVVQPRPVPPMPSLVRVGVNGGDARPLSLNDAIRRALENNNDIEVARNDVRLSESFLRALNGQYDPVLTFTPQIDSSVSPLTSIFNAGTESRGTISRTEFSFGPTVSKRIGVGGGQYDFFFNNSRVSTDSNGSPFDSSYSSSLGVTFTQPLWRNRAIDGLRRDIRIQRKRVEQSDADFRRRTIDVISQVQRAYWDLVFALRDEQNQVANLNLARENFRRTEAGVAAGASAPLERAEVQTELSNRESALLLASQSVTVAENALKALMLKDSTAPEWSVALIPTDQPAFDATPVNLQDALTEARSNRPELKRLRLQLDVNDIDVKYFKNQTKPRIDLQATVSTTGLAGTPRPSDPTDEFPNPPPPENLVGGFGRNIRNLFGFDTRNVVVGVAFSIPLRNRTAEANLAGARIDRDQLAAQTRGQEQTVEVEVRNSVQAVETARRRVLSARTARENAELQLAGERRLYQVGRTTTYFLFLRENQLVNARNQELRAETDYNKALADLQRATSTTLRANNVIVETPTMP